MDDLEFRRRCTINPYDKSREFQAKCREDADAARLVREMANFDHSLRQACQVSVPDDLAERILLQQKLTNHQQRYQRRRPLLALAASLLLVVGLLSFCYMQATPLPQQVVAHVYGELPLLAMRQEIPAERLQIMLQAFGGKMHGNIGRIYHVGFCDIDKYHGIHLILAGEQGAVTVLYLDAVQLAAPLPIGDQRFEGEFLSARSGSFAIIGERGETALQPIKQRLLENIRWST